MKQTGKSVKLRDIQKQIRSLADPKIAEHSLRFFKTGKGEYAEGDQYLGVRVPVTREIAKVFKDIPINVMFKLLESKFHEERLLALIMMVNRFKRANDQEQKTIYKHYLSHTHLVNNWDLVDSSAHFIVGAYLWDKNRNPLYKLAKSKLLWDRRIAVIATFFFIRKGDFADLLEISKRLLKDPEDLMHKAVGWMLREMGKRDQQVETMFLDEHYRSMPRTMLRYAIEKYSEKDRQAYLKGLR